MEISFKNVASTVMIITLSVALGIILADTWMYNREMRRQQKALQNGHSK